MSTFSMGMRVQLSEDGLRADGLAHLPRDVRGTVVDFGEIAGHGPLSGRHVVCVLVEGSDTPMHWDERFWEPSRDR